MREADLGLVSLVPGVIAYAYPSKTATYLSEGLPVLAAVEPDSGLAREILEWGVGGVLCVETTDSVVNALAAWAERKEELTAMRGRAADAWREHFSADTKLKEWDGLLAEAVSIGRPS
jgi:glycosyltransferase involved in cell wall biosynthesis